MTPDDTVFATFVTAFIAAVIGEPIILEVIFLDGLGGEVTFGNRLDVTVGAAGTGTAPRIKKARMPKRMNMIVTPIIMAGA